MAINPTDAIRAFNQAAKLGGDGDGMEARATPATGSFKELMEKVVDDTMTTGMKAEAVTAKAITGEAELLDVVAAVSNAEMTLQAVVAVRDRVLSAYQEIMRMPI